jgi:hypothetical protein
VLLNVVSRQFPTIDGRLILKMNTLADVNNYCLQVLYLPAFRQYTSTVFFRSKVGGESPGVPVCGPVYSDKHGIPPEVELIEIPGGIVKIGRQ